HVHATRQGGAARLEPVADTGAGELVLDIRPRRRGGAAALAAGHAGALAQRGRRPGRGRGAGDAAVVRRGARARRGVSVRRGVGASATQCIALAAPEPTADDAQAARELVKAKYSDAEWADVARPLRDKLREGERQALVAYLVPRANAAKGQRWHDADGLYGHF